MRYVTAHSVAQYIEIVCKIRRNWSLIDRKYFDPWFRGHQRNDWKLEPNIFRIEMEGAEGELRSEFQRRSGHITIEREPRNEWEWYFLMQHYRAPTRLLDWTDSALVALFFAVSANLPGEPRVQHDAAVWVLDPWWLNKLVLGDPSILMPDYDEAASYLPDPDNGVLRRKWPVAIDPPHIARRVGLQRSHFTVFGRSRDGLQRLATRRGSRLVKISLPREAIPYMRLDLSTCGLCDTLMFPDLEGLSRELTRFYADSWEDQLAPYPGRSGPKSTKNGKFGHRK